MAFACIDIGSNTTRLLVCERHEGRLRELLTHRAFTRLGRASRSGRVPSAKVLELADLVMTQTAMARAAGARRVEVVATAAVRAAANRDELVAAVERAAGVRVRVISAGEEARLAFVGATKTLGVPVSGSVGVVDVGGGSTEIATGTATGGVEWWSSLPVGSGTLADLHIRSDPPRPKDVKAMRRHLESAFAGLDVPRPRRVVAVGGTASALRRVVGAELDPDTLERALSRVSRAPAAEVAARFELEGDRVRLLPGGTLILDAVARAIERPLMIGRGGLREGVILESLGRDAVMDDQEMTWRRPARSPA